VDEGTREQRKFPPLQIPASYNLDEIEKMIADHADHSHSE
jgi:hypothetical protein